jgi:hypothetical protein
VASCRRGLTLPTFPAEAGKLLSDEGRAEKSLVRHIVFRKLAERTTIEIDLAVCLRSAFVVVSLIIVALRPREALAALVRILGS